MDDSASNAGNFLGGKLGHVRTILPRHGALGFRSSPSLADLTEAPTLGRPPVIFTDHELVPPWRFDLTKNAPSIPT